MVGGVGEAGLKFLMTLRVNRSSQGLQTYTTVRHLIRFLSVSLEHVELLRSTYAVLSGMIVKMLQCYLQRRDRGGEAGMEGEQDRHMVLRLHSYSTASWSRFTLIASARLVSSPDESARTEIPLCFTACQLHRCCAAKL